MKPLAIVIARSNRTELFQQTINTLEKTLKVPYRIYTRNGMLDGEIKTVNDLVASIDYDWEWLLRSDDDMFYNEGWYEKAMSIFNKENNIVLVNGCRYPTHNILFSGMDYHIMDIAPGNSWLMPRSTWNEFGPLGKDLPKGVADDQWFCEKIRETGRKIAVIKKGTYVVHCGVTNSNGRGRGTLVEAYMMNLINKVGAKYK